ncbi:Uncharacterised protein [Mycobacterium tuberculosis]|uniref:Uncharacterized protein n=1 Tax=Mycobacterium tuberculosis TaxID=1773 RepID=A0A655AJ71_MYCTX|nr:Uncharacterised protein [Mycobacterium tuberculosis]CNL26716.1 Uncharacterised protein [Mycobacterium tuberculosis]
MGNITLVVPLTPLAIRRRGQCRDTSHSRVEVLGDPFDGATLTSSVTAFEDDHQTRTRMPGPLLQLHEFCLQPKQFGLVDGIGDLAPARRS